MSEPNERQQVDGNGEVLEKKQGLRAALHSDSQLLFAMMEASPLCLHIWARDGRLLGCNSEVIRLLGAKDKEDVLIHFFSFCPTVQPDGLSSREKVSTALERAFSTGEQETFFWLHLTRKGEEVPVEVTLVRVPYEGSYVVTSYARDLRPQRAMEEKNKRFNQRMKAILDATPLCLNLWNTRYQNIMCNKAAVELFALQDEAEYIREFVNLSPGQQPDGSPSEEKAREKIKLAFETGRASFSWIHCKKSGEIIPVEITLVKIDELDEDGGPLVAGYTRDIRLQLAAEAAERKASQRVRAVLDSSPLTCILWDMEGNTLDCNQVALQMFGVASKEVLLHNFDRFLPENQPDGSHSLSRKEERFREVRTKKKCTFEWMYIGDKGEEIPSEVSMVCLRTGAEEIIVAYSRDLRELRRSLELNRRLSEIAYSDALTGSASRHSFMEEFQIKFQQQQKSLGLLMFDFDHFKGINDTYGHAAGDMTLCRVVEEVTALLPPCAHLGRFGGDEFMISLVDMDREATCDLVSAIVDRVSQLSLWAGGREFATSISIGGTLRLPEDSNCAQLLERADRALYQAKELGRNRGVCI